jgi:hypothetical protein
VAKVWQILWMITSCGLYHKFLKKNNLDNNYTQGVVKLARETF